MIKGLTIETTANATTLRRWMLAPSIVQGVTIGLSVTAAETERLFKEELRNPANVFWLVKWQGKEQGVVMMRQVAEGWEPHLCLATQRPHTREVMRELFQRVAGTIIVFRFCTLHDRMERLADDLGFGPPLVRRCDQPPGAIAPWCIRRLIVPPP